MIFYNEDAYLMIITLYSAITQEMCLHIKKDYRGLGVELKFAHDVFSILPIKRKSWQKQTYHTDQHLAAKLMLPAGFWLP